jgi:hypothetical protein
MDIVEELLEIIKVEIVNKQGLFLNLCAFNYLNALVKMPKNKGRIGYETIKPAVLQMVIYLKNKGKIDLCEEIYAKTEEDCIYIRCYGLQFSFHHINSIVLTEKWPELNNPQVQWDGIKLQPMAESLYNLSREVVGKSMGQNDIKIRINDILMTYGHL